jgi:two-component system phosphate regulon sensor histidine kinase PhoR
MPYKIAYPWFFFSKIVRLSLLVFLPSFLLFLYLIRSFVGEKLTSSELAVFDEFLGTRIIPLALITYLLFLFFFYKTSRPLGNVLAKLQKFKDDIPFASTLRHFYQKDEWAHIEEALNKADKRLQDQVTQVKNENEKIGAILESIYDDIIAIDNFETVLFYNSNFKRNFFQEKSEGDIIPKIWHTFNDEEVLKAFRHVLKSGENASLKAMNFLSSQHPERYFDLTITPLKGADGKITGALGVFYDVTEFKLTEQMRVNFVANVSHEIRTPLTSIKGYTQILQTQADKMDEEAKIFLNRIISNTERMISLFNDLLNLSVIESKNLIRFEELDLTTLIENVSDNMKTNYSQKKISIDLELKLPIIRGDQRLMEQVISNLIDNACKYSGNDISIKVESFEKNGKAYIIVADKGPGISKEHLQRIFERFYRIESSREEMRGTGLGLSIVKHIIAKHGGRIWAESENQKGTTFIIELPLE